MGVCDECVCVCMCEIVCAVHCKTLHNHVNSILIHVANNNTRREGENLLEYKYVSYYDLLVATHVQWHMRKSHQLRVAHVQLTGCHVTLCTVFVCVEVSIVRHSSVFIYS